MRGTGAAKLDLEKLKALAGRGALLNIVVHRDVAHFRSGESIGAEELETYARDQGVQVGEGDILLFRTGWLENYSVDLAMDFWKSNPGLGASAAE